MKIYRTIYHGYFTDENEEKIIELIPYLRGNLIEEVNNHKLLAISLFRWENHLFLYCEHNDESYHTDLFTSSITEYLVKIQFYSDHKWHKMWDIFHTNYPSDENQWKRKISSKTSTMRINRLKREKFSSYIFYHFQRQEEHRTEHDKYGLICQDDGLMVYYLETPVESELPPNPGILSTSNTPSEKEWHELMGEHFIPWPNYDKPWLIMECLIDLIY